MKVILTIGNHKRLYWDNGKESFPSPSVTEASMDAIEAAEPGEHQYSMTLLDENPGEVLALARLLLDVSCDRYTSAYSIGTLAHLVSTEKIESFTLHCVDDQLVAEVQAKHWCGMVGPVVNTVHTSHTLQHFLSDFGEAIEGRNK